MRREPRPTDPDRLIARQPWATLRPLLSGGEAEVDRTLEALRTYALRLLEWNRGVSNLISRNDESRLVERHLFESLFPASLILATGAKRLMDFGSGAGLPAIPLAIAGVGEHWLLVESRRNKTLFMRKTIQDFGLEQIDVATTRLESLPTESSAGLFDAFTSRATMTLGPTLELAGRYVRPNGRAFLWKGSRWEGEMNETRATWDPSWTFVRVVEIENGPNVVAVFERR